MKIQRTSGIRRFLHGLRRIVILSAIVIFSGAMYCTKIEHGVRFAPGHGYVVQVEETNDRHRYVHYYVFETEQAASEWAYKFQQNPSKNRAMDEPGYLKKVSTDFEKNNRDPEWLDIKRALESPPPVRTMTQPIDQVVPPVPTAPAPQ